MLTAETLIDIAKTFGSPVYVYDADKIKTQYQKLTEHFKHTQTRFFYACKALTNINILKYVKQLGASVDCVSINEIQLALKAGFEPQQILYTPNCVSIEEIETAKNFGVNLNIDNISILEQFGNKFGNSYPIIIRFNPHILAGGNYKISTGHIDSKFGISIHQLRHVERIVKTTQLQVQGLHMHTGSEIKDVDVFLQGLQVMLELAEHFTDIQFINLGSGFKVAYKKDDIETNTEQMGHRVAEVLNEFAIKNNRPLELWFEPGKFLVSESGYFIAKANVIKQTPATVFVGINSGFNHFIRPMFYNAYHKIINLSNPQGAERIYTIVGTICETDTFAWDRTLNEVRENDLLAFYNAGAYGFEMSSNFNSTLRPAEVLVLDGKPHLIRRREEFDDLLKTQIIVL